jgi:hypothetical protein
MSRASRATSPLLPGTLELILQLLQAEPTNGTTCHFAFRRSRRTASTSTLGGGVEQMLAMARANLRTCERESDER